MEKRIPHYSATEVRARIAEHGITAFTATALFNIAAMGLSVEQALEVLASITRSMFYKSMTTIADPRVWQDVYHVPLPRGRVAYVKVTLHEGAVVIQFKEK